MAKAFPQDIDTYFCVALTPLRVKLQSKMRWVVDLRFCCKAVPHHIVDCDFRNTCYCFITDYDLPSVCLPAMFLFNNRTCLNPVEPTQSQVMKQMRVNGLQPWVIPFPLTHFTNDSHRIEVTPLRSSIGLRLTTLSGLFPYVMSILQRNDEKVRSSAMRQEKL